MAQSGPPAALPALLTGLGGFIDQFCSYIVEWAIRKEFRQSCENCGGIGIESLGPNHQATCAMCKGAKVQPNSRNFAEEGMLVVTEVAELVEAHRRGQMDEPDEHCPEFTKGEVEIADAMIRLMDMAGAKGMRLGSALAAKQKYNETRPPKHGKKY